MISGTAAIFPEAKLIFWLKWGVFLIILFRLVANLFFFEYNNAIRLILYPSTLTSSFYFNTDLKLLKNDTIRSIKDISQKVFTECIENHLNLVNNSSTATNYHVKESFNKNNIYNIIGICFLQSKGVTTDMMKNTSSNPTKTKKFKLLMFCMLFASILPLLEYIYFKITKIKNEVSFKKEIKQKKEDKSQLQMESTSRNVELDGIFKEPDLSKIKTVIDTQNERETENLPQNLKKQNIGLESTNSKKHVKTFKDKSINSKSELNFSLASDNRQRSNENSVFNITQSIPPQHFLPSNFVSKMSNLSTSSKPTMVAEKKQLVNPFLSKVNPPAGLTNSKKEKKIKYSYQELFKIQAIVSVNTSEKKNNELKTKYYDQIFDGSQSKFDFETFYNECIKGKVEYISINEDSSLYFQGDSNNNNYVSDNTTSKNEMGGNSFNRNTSSQIKNPSPIDQPQYSRPGQFNKDLDLEPDKFQNTENIQCSNFSVHPNIVENPSNILSPNKTEGEVPSTYTMQEKTEILCYEDNHINNNQSVNNTTSVRLDFEKAPERDSSSKKDISFEPLCSVNKTTHQVYSEKSLNPGYQSNIQGNLSNKNSVAQEMPQTELDDRSNDKINKEKKYIVGIKPKQQKPLISYADIYKNDQMTNFNSKLVKEGGTSDSKPIDNEQLELVEEKTGKNVAYDEQNYFEHGTSNYTVINSTGKNEVEANSIIEDLNSQNITSDEKKKQTEKRIEGEVISSYQNLNCQKNEIKPRFEVYVPRKDFGNSFDLTSETGRLQFKEYIRAKKAKNMKENPVFAPSIKHVKQTQDKQKLFENGNSEIPFLNYPLYISTKQEFSEPAEKPPKKVFIKNVGWVSKSKANELLQNDNETI
ncbi:hypothetical protein TBLA_0D00970 [Henningerozyma blattae CBS 6284]|uniref:Uncharacterized protein n=1 Tax=Henningerozyma blattae (strain ATCC 34711 / CBS 6284 / DSM 70876 / NBRC 10599 / NRRL Y-10934 / UCD 77-7) TaxID=1071380 RepID=I2H2K3_HENB6|nr:hypothetical protein TBLA_0D00970 [Tetrapisispora blattae CBS 6284]CCH60605.1 hypothetical protein TBLA_0D00970 [Tetrapisispora blattae CBS 6284]